MGKAEAILFDFGETLVTYSPPREQLFVEAAACAGVELDPETVKRAYWGVDDEMKFSSVSIMDASGREGFYREFNSRICRMAGAERHFDQVSPHIRRLFKDKGHWVLRHNAVKVLEQLRNAGYRLGVLANWDNSLKGVIDGFGIGGLFETIVASAEVGVEKPDVAIFLSALKNMDLVRQADRVLYVGNEYRADIEGSRSAGLIPVLLDVDGRYKSADCQRIESFEALPVIAG